VNQIDGFVQRHLGPSHSDQALMLERLGCQNLEELLQQCVPAAILLSPEEALAVYPRVALKVRPWLICKNWPVKISCCAV